MISPLTKRLINKKVGIAGAGGLGSNCAVALARSGVSHLVVADFDVVVESNLNRQYFFYDQLGLPKVEALKTNIERMIPDIDIQVHQIRLDEQNIPSIFADCDIIVEAFDAASAKQMLIETVLSIWPEKYLVAGVGMAGWGGSDSLKVRRFDHLIVCGDGVSEVSDEWPPLAARVGVVANLQANEVLELLMNME